MLHHRGTSDNKIERTKCQKRTVNQCMIKINALGCYISFSKKGVGVGGIKLGVTANAGPHVIQLGGQNDNFNIIMYDQCLFDIQVLRC